VAKEIIDLLAELPPEELAAMLEKNQQALTRARTELARRELEEQQLKAAVAKRRKPGRRGPLTPEIVLDAARDTEPPMTASTVQETLVERGLNVTVNAVRNHLNALVERGDLERDEKRRYLISAPMFVPAGLTESSDFPAAADDDIPF
jgi:DNA-binding IclR family transcriptional regulator